MNQSTDGSVILESNLRSHFNLMVEEAMVSLKVSASEEARCYLENLLMSYLDSGALFTDTSDGRQIRPLAMLFGEALSAGQSEHGNRLLKRLGDQSLFVSGLFGDSLNRQLVDIDYYIAMGGGAYQCLSNAASGRRHWHLQRETFAELAEKFADFVDVLTEVSERASLRNDKDTLRLYETWIRTGSRRAEKQLRMRGIDPVRPADPLAAH